MAYIHGCTQCTTDGTPDYDNEFWHSIYMGHPIEYGISHTTGKRHYHSNSWESGTLAGIRERIKDAERPVGGYPNELLSL